MEKVLIVNKFYYSRGGDCVYAMNLERLLRDNGHQVAIYAMNHPENIESSYTPYFASTVDFSSGLDGKIKALARVLGFGDIVKSFSHILDDFKPNVVHLQNIHSYLSPRLAQLAHSRGIKVVWTLHDFKLICPSYSCLRDGKPCELCFENKINVIKTRCMKGSHVASVIAYIEALRWNQDVLERYVDKFICPSKFMYEKMVGCGFNKNKLEHLCNFVDPDKCKVITQEREDYYCYVGRLSREKGVETLLSVAAKLPYRLKIAGDGPLVEELRKNYVSFSQIEFLGRLNAPQVAELLSKARLLVMPSECYENNPLGVIEALCAGTPIVGANIGGIPELFDSETGIAFVCGDAESMSLKIQSALSKTWDNQRIKENSLKRFSQEKYYKDLLKIYRK